MTYGEVDTYFAGGDIAVAIPGTFSVALTGDWKGARLDSDFELPYFANFEAGLRATYTFAGDRAILQGDGKYIGSRYADRLGERELPGYLDLSALVSYYVTPSIGIYGRAKSITVRLLSAGRGIRLQIGLSWAACGSAGEDNKIR